VDAFGEGVSEVAVGDQVGALLETASPGDRERQAKVAANRMVLDERPNGRHGALLSD
jgi:hypothetical protein